jgi:ATP-dependent DNA helicase RecQ
VADRLQDIRRVAREAFGFDRLRPGQEEVVAAVLDGRDALAVMRTGYGKSAIYQIAGLLLDGPTLVISPLIALQREQVEDLDTEATGGAAAVSSAVAEGERREALRDAGRDRLEFLFMTPEQLANPEVLADVRRARPSLMVVDEAHCISEWGHDFRPDYLRLGAVAEEVGRPVVLALTATASPPVRAEIVDRLRMRDPLVEVSGFNRPNIHLSVERHFDESPKRRALLERVAELEKPGIVYAATRATADEIAAAIRDCGLRAASYHAGMPKSERELIQSAFMEDELDLVVATTAFGMGVDKPNVRFVLHHAIADSVDSYYQEIGRAGRDGEPARAILMYRAEDVGLRRFFAGSGQVDGEQIERVADAVRDAGGEIPAAELLERTELSESKLTTALGRLEDVGAVEVRPGGDVAATADLNDGELVEDATALQEDREAFDRSRVDMIRGYAELDRGCRREYMLSYFGEPFEGPCGACDNCDAGLSERAPADRPFALGARAEHPKWGPGTVQRYESDKVVVLFDSVGYKALALDAVLERGLLAEIETG